MNEVMRVLTNRASLRNFSDEPVTDEELKQVLAASIQGASGGNLQPFSIITVRNRDTSSWLGEKCDQEFIGGAPVNLIYCIDWKRTADWRRSSETITKAAHKSGGAFREVPGACGGGTP